jgi:hypothetical protein
MRSTSTAPSRRTLLRAAGSFHGTLALTADGNVDHPTLIATMTPSLVGTIVET